MQPIPLPAPWGGVNDQVPVQGLQQPNCEENLNFHSVTEGLQLRYGEELAKFLGSGIQYAGGKFITDNANRLWFAATRQSSNEVVVRTAGSGGIAYTSAALPSPNNYLTTSTFNKYAFLFNNVGVGYSVDFATYTWGVSGYTGSGYIPIMGATYKNRHYMPQKDENAYWYSGIDAIAGALTKVDLASQLRIHSAGLAMIVPFSISDIQSSDILAFIFYSGEVLFYSGNYPDSADWSGVGKAQIGLPLAPDSFLLYEGDALIFCRSGVVSLRELFTKGSKQALNLSVNTKIQRHWANLIGQYPAATPIGVSAAFYGLSASVRAAWDPLNCRITISFPVYIDSSGAKQVGSTYFVYDTLRESWSIHRSFGASESGKTSGVEDVCYYNGILYGAMIPKVSTYGAIIFTKDFVSAATQQYFQDIRYDAVSYISYDYNVTSAPITNGRAYVQKGEGLDVIVKSDLHAETNYYLVRDFGVQTTTAQKVGTTPSGSLQKPSVNMGIEGTYIQYKISGTTAASKTVGYQLYGLNFWVEMGESPR